MAFDESSAETNDENRPPTGAASGWGKGKVNQASGIQIQKGGKGKAICRVQDSRAMAGKDR